MDSKLNAGDYPRLVKAVAGEIGEVLSRVAPEEVGAFAKEILAADKVFVFAVGRVFLALQCLAKRLVHLGIDTQVVGSVTETPITAKDLLIVASGSGESKLPVEITRIARTHGARLGLITAAADSTARSMADIVVELPSPTKTDRKEGVRSIQPMGALFDQCLHVFGDILCLIIQRRKGLEDEELWKRHANLE